MSEWHSDIMREIVTKLPIPDNATDEEINAIQEERAALYETKYDEMLAKVEKELV